MDWCLWVYRQVYWCRRSLIKQFCPKEEPKKVHVHSDSLPWFWIGMKYSDDSSVTVTDVINTEIQYGDCVTPEYLSRITGFRDGTWRYMSAKTLEELDFPSVGFIIEDVLDKPISDSE